MSVCVRGTLMPQLKSGGQKTASGTIPHCLRQSILLTGHTHQASRQTVSGEFPVSVSSLSCRSTGTLAHLALRGFWESEFRSLPSKHLTFWASSSINEKVVEVEPFQLLTPCCVRLLQWLSPVRWWWQRLMGDSKI